MNDETVVAGTRKLERFPIKVNACKVQGDAEDKDMLTIRIPWHELWGAHVYDLTLAVMQPDGHALLVENELWNKKDEGESVKEIYDVLDVVILPVSRQLFPDNLENLQYEVSAEVSRKNGRAWILVMFQGKS